MQQELIEQKIDAGEVINRTDKMIRMYAKDDDDCYQSICLAIIKGIDTYDPEKGELTTWVSHVAMNYLISKYTYDNRQIRSIKCDEGKTLPTYSIDSVNFDQSSSEMLSCRDEAMSEMIDEENCQLALSVLDERELQVIYMRIWQDMTLATIGEYLGLSHERIRGIQNKALHKMKLKIWDSGDDV